MAGGRLFGRAPRIPPSIGPWGLPCCTIRCGSRASRPNEGRGASRRELRGRGGVEVLLLQRRTASLLRASMIEPLVLLAAAPTPPMIAGAPAHEAAHDARRGAAAPHRPSGPTPS